MPRPPPSTSQGSLAFDFTGCTDNGFMFHCFTSEQHAVCKEKKTVSTSQMVDIAQSEVDAFLPSGL